MALEAYNPKLITAWQKGALKTVELKFPDKKLATKLRQKLYRLRVELVKANHPAAANAQRAQVRIVGPDAENNWWLLIEPEGREYDEALDAAGLELQVPDIDI